MKNINIKIIGLMMVIVGSMSSCDDFLDQEPQDEVTEVIYFETPDQFEFAANYLYTRFAFDEADEETDLSNNIGDGSVVYSRGGTVSAPTDDIWTDNYEELRAANQLIEKAAEYVGEQSDIAVSIGTAHWFRAWHYDRLLKRFGGVPLVLVAPKPSADSPELYAPRNSRYEVVHQMLSDLDIAIANLPAASDLADSDRGKLSVEAAKAFKARILLYEATWERYVGTSTDGDGTSVGAGSAKPAGYLSIDAMLTEAIGQAEDVMVSGSFELWDHTAELGEENLFYLFVLDDGGGNPMGYSKADNKEFILQSVYDFTLRQINENLSHSKKFGPSRKMMDMYLCSDGLPVQHSAVFQGYSTITSEYENRDHRLHLGTRTPLVEYWGYGSGSTGGGAQYGVDFADSGIDFDYRYVPDLGAVAVRNNGYQGRKFVTEHIQRESREESFDYPIIRLAEAHLIFAEATVELNGSISDADLDRSINLIRARSGVASLTNALIAPYADLTMLGEIRRERAIELFGEGFRYDDLKRWNIAPEELNKGVCLNYITGTELETALNPKDDSPIFNAASWTLTTTEESFSSYSGIATTKPGAIVFEGPGVRNFRLENYIDPIPSDEINLNPNLTQNPGW